MRPDDVVDQGLATPPDTEADADELEFDFALDEPALAAGAVPRQGERRLFDFGADEPWEPPANAPVAALPPWMQPAAPAAVQVAELAELEPPTAVDAPEPVEVLAALEAVYESVEPVEPVVESTLAAGAVPEARRAEVDDRPRGRRRRAEPEDVPALVVPLLLLPLQPAEPAAETPAVEAPAVELPAGEAPAVEMPAVPKPVVPKPVVPKPVVGAPVRPGKVAIPAPAGPVSVPVSVAAKSVPVPVAAPEQTVHSNVAPAVLDQVSGHAPTAPREPAPAPAVPTLVALTVPPAAPPKAPPKMFEPFVQPTGRAARKADKAAAIEPVEPPADAPVDAVVEPVVEPVPELAAEAPAPKSARIGRRTKRPAPEPVAELMSEAEPETEPEPEPAPARDRRQERRKPPAPPKVTRQRRRTSPLLRFAPAAVFGMVAALGGSMLFDGGAGADAEIVTDAPAAAARDWVLTNLDLAMTVLAPKATARDLTARGHESDRVVGYDESSGSKVDSTCCSFLIVTGTSKSDAAKGLPSSVKKAYDRSRATAAFGSDGRYAEVRQILNLAPSQVAASVESDRKILAAAGRELASNDRIELSDDAEEILVKGGVDPRVAVAVVSVTGAHKLEISAFPEGPGEASTGAWRRSVMITRIDGQGVAPGSDAVKAVQDLLDAQKSPYRPDATSVTKDGDVTTLTITFRAPSPLGLLASAN